MSPARATERATSARIMIVDDDHASLKLLDLMLRSEGYSNLELVQDPREVLTRYRAAHPDLMLLDINMPALNGLDLMARLRDLDDALAPSIIVLSAQADEETLLRAFRVGASDFLGKPFSRRELLARVRNTLLARLAQRMLRDHNAVLDELARDRTQALRDAQLDIVLRLGLAAEFRDNATGEHLLRMSASAALLARHAGWDATACELLLNASSLHDVGTIAIPDSILFKHGGLTPEEREIMQTHTLIGARLLAGSDSEVLEMGRVIALAHHERWDGQGYPHGLAGQEIPESARIVAVADVFDALRSARPHRLPWSVERAVEFMHDEAGRHFDPRLIERFLPLVPEIEANRSGMRPDWLELVTA